MISSPKSSVIRRRIRPIYARALSRMMEELESRQLLSGLFISDWGTNPNGLIQESGFDGSGVHAVVSGLNSPSGVALDVANGKMYWADTATNEIQRSNLDGTNVENLDTGSAPVAVALDLVNSKIYWIDGGVISGQSMIERANLDGTGQETLYTTSFTGLFGLTLDVAGGKMYWTDSTAGTITRANLDGSSVEPLITSGLSTPQGIDVNTTHGKIYWIDGAAHSIERANLDGSSIENLLTSASVDGPGITLDVPNAELYWTNQDTGKVERANLNAASVQDVVTSGLTAPRFVALDTTAPTAIVSLATGQTDPTNGAPVNFKVVFSEPVVGFVSGVTIGGTAGATTAKITGAGTTYNITISGMTQSGSVSLTIPDAVASSLAGTPNTSSDTESAQYNRPVTHLVITQKPASTVAGHPVGPSIIVQLLDASNHVVAADNSDAVISILSSTNGGTLAGTATVHAVSGVATFSNVILTKAGTYKLHIAYGNLAAIDTGSFSITPDLANTQLVLFQQPAATIVGKPLSPSAIFTVEDEFANIVTTNHTKVTLGIVSGPGVLSGTSTVTLSGGKATFKNFKLSTAGTYTLVGSDPLLAINTPVQYTQIVNPGVTTAPTPHPASSYTFGKTISLTESIKSTAPTNIPFSGVATVTDQDSNVLGSVTLTAAGVAKFAITGVAPGTYMCQVNYPGDTNHTAATSPAFTVVVTTASTTTTLVPSATTLFSGQSLTLTATVASSGAPATDRTGTITFLDGVTVIDVEPVSGNTAATLVAAPTTGSHAYKAVYSGDSNFKTSTSSGHTLTVKKDNTSIALTVPAGPFVPGQAFDMTADVAALAPGVGTPTGNVVFKDGSTTLGTIALNDAGEAVLSASLPTAGTHNLTAAYVGDANSSPKTSTSLVRVVDKAATTATVTSPNASVSSGTNVTFTAVVAPNDPASLVPTGKVVFKDGLTTLATVTLTAGQAVFTTAIPLSVGDHSITATYLGDANDDPIVSDPWTQSVVAPV